MALMEPTTPTSCPPRKQVTWTHHRPPQEAMPAMMESIAARPLAEVQMVKLGIPVNQEKVGVTEGMET